MLLQAGHTNVETPLANSTAQVPSSQNPKASTKIPPFFQKSPTSGLSYKLEKAHSHIGMTVLC